MTSRMSQNMKGVSLRNMGELKMLTHVKITLLDKISICTHVSFHLSTADRFIMMEVWMPTFIVSILFTALLSCFYIDL
jgi:hypothetical protein